MHLWNTCPLLSVWLHKRTRHSEPWVDSSWVGHWCCRIPLLHRQKTPELAHGLTEQKVKGRFLRRIGIDMCSGGRLWPALQGPNGRRTERCLRKLDPAAFHSSGAFLKVSTYQVESKAHSQQTSESELPYQAPSGFKDRKNDGVKKKTTNKTSQGRSWQKTEKTGSESGIC